MDERIKISLYRTSNSGSTPNASSLADGELSMNLHKDTPMLMFNNSENEIEKVLPSLNSTGSSEYHTMTQKAITEEFILPSDYNVEYPEDTGASSFTTTLASSDIKTAIKNIDENVSKLVGATLDNEEVVAAALTKLKESAGFNSNGEYVIDSESKYLSGASTLATADKMLEIAISGFDTNVSGINTTVSELSTNLQTLSGTVEQLTANTGNDIDIEFITSGDGSTFLSNDGTYKAITVPTKTSELTNDSNFATSGYVDNKVAELVNSAPDALNTLDELAAALGDDANFAATVTNQISAKADKATTLSGYGITDASIDESTKTITLGENTLTITDPILSESYSSVVYPSVTTVTEDNSELFIPASKGQTMDAAIYAVDLNVSKLVKEVIDNEEVTAVAFTKMKESIGLNDNGEYTPYTGSSIISTAKSLHGADIKLADEISSISSSISNFVTNDELTTTLSDYVKSDNIPSNIATKEDLNNYYTTGNTYSKDEIDGLIGGVSLTEDYVAFEQTEIGEDYLTANTIGNDLTTAVMTIESNLVKIANEVVSNEIVCAAALTDLNENKANQSDLEAINNTVNISIDSFEEDLANMENNYDNLEAIVASINSYVGLTSSGTFTTISGNYVSSATNVITAITALDSQVKKNADNISSATTNVSTLTTNLNTLSGNVTTLSTNFNTVSGDVDTLKTTVENKIAYEDVKLSTAFTPTTLVNVGEGDNDSSVAMKQNAVGNSLDSVVMNIEFNLNNLANEINENETVAAYALSDLDTRIVNHTNDISIHVLEEEKIKWNEIYNFYEGSNSVSSLSSVPVSKRLCIATISANATLSLASVPSAGREINIIIKNSSTSDIVVTLPTSSNYINMSGDSITVVGSGYGEINIISDGTNMYLRAL